MVLSVAVDASDLSGGSQYRGIGTYVRQILSGLSTHPGIELVALADPDAALPLTVRRRDPAHLVMRVLRPGTSVRGCDVLLSPGQSPPRSSRVPWVQTLHDLTPLVWDDPLLRRDARRWRRIGPRLQHAAAVICPSASAAKQGQTLLGIAESRLHVIPHGVTAFAAQRAPAPPTPEHPYLLMVSAWGPHKGFPEAVEVMDRLVEDGLPHRLAIVGPRDEWSLQNVRRIVGAGRHPDRIDIVGYAEDLGALYRNASAVLVTSRAEGFGLPALEAMSCGAAVVSFDNTSLPEVVQDGGMLVPDGDTGAMADRLRTLLTDGRLRKQVATKGRTHAATFTWERSVEAHVKVLTEAAGE